MFVISLLSTVQTTSGVGIDYPFTKTEYEKPVNYHIPIMNWSGDIHQTIVEYNLVARPEHFQALRKVFFMFRLSEKPDELWLFGPPKVRKEWRREWKKYDPKDGPTSYDFASAITYITNGYNSVKNPSVYLAGAADLSDIGGVGEVLVGYGLGWEDDAAYQEMWQAGRVKVIWNTEKSEYNDSLTLSVGSVWRATPGTGPAYFSP
jgi:hypothetical protein